MTRWNSQGWAYLSEKGHYISKLQVFFQSTQWVVANLSFERLIWLEAQDKWKARTKVAIENRSGSLSHVFASTQVINKWLVEVYFESSHHLKFIKKKLEGEERSSIIWNEESVINIVESSPLRIFSKPSAVNGFEVPLPTTVWVGLAMLFPSAW